MCDLLFGIVDLFSILLIFLPLYPDTVDGFVYSVSLFDYSDISPLNKAFCWLGVILLLVFGLLKVVFSKINHQKGGKVITEASLVVNVLFVLFLGLTRQAYAVTVAVLLLITKGLILLKHTKGK